MLISFVIPVFDTDAFLNETITSIQKSCTNFDIEIILVDNNAKFSLDRFISGHPLPRIIKEKRQGASFARNKGVEASNGEWLAFIDSDCVIQPGWLEACFELTKFSQLIQCVQSAVIPSSKSEKSFLDSYRYQYTSLLTKNTFSYFSNDTTYPSLNTAAVIISRIAFESVNGFSEDLNRLEDTDFTFKLLREGYYIGVSEKARALVYNNHNSYFKYLRRSFWIGLYAYKVSSKWKTPSAGYQFNQIKFPDAKLQFFHSLSSNAKRIGMWFGSIKRRNEVQLLIYNKINNKFLLTQNELNDKSYFIHPDWRLFIFEDKIICMDFRKNLGATVRGEDASNLKGFLQMTLTEEALNKTIEKLPFFSSVSLGLHQSGKRQHEINESKS